MTIKGIDISHWNRILDFDKVKEDNIDFCIIKAGGSDKGFYTDSQFENNYRRAKLAGLYVGCYYFVGKYFLSKEDGIEDAKRFHKIIYGKDFEFPVCLDIETTDPKYKEGATAASIAFCDYLEKQGYYVSIYASDISGFKEKLNLDDLKAYDKWVARYGKRPEYVKDFGIWQKSSTGKVKGIEGNVDLDVAYKDYPSIMKKGGFNLCR